MSNNTNKTWSAQKYKDIEEHSEEMLLRLTEVYKDILDVDKAVKLGYISVFNVKGQVWSREAVKLWMARECQGKCEFSTYHCAFELESDASNFILTWL